MIIYFDLDGVMANLEKAMAEQLGEHYWSRTDNSYWAKMEKVPNLFYDLDLMPDSLYMFDKVASQVGINRVEILTALPEPTGLLHTAKDDKTNWVHDLVHPTVKVNTVVGGKNKVQFLQQTPGAVLIDDWHRNIELWIEHGGVGILHTDPHSTLAKLKALGVIKWV